MNAEVFKRIIKEGQEEILNVELYYRNFDFEENGRYVLVGVRQAGKSYLLYQRAKSLIHNGVSINDIVYVNFDDERLLGMTAGDFDLILQAYSSMYSGTPVLFFDEIQNIDGWEHFARRLANQKYKIFITGSNAKMLSRDIATTLGGRFFDDVVYPYSFAEYVGSKGVALDENWMYSDVKNDVIRYFNEYFYWGGFPELQLYSNKRNWLNGLYEKILLGDIILRNKVKNGNAIRLAIKRLAENIKQPTAYNRLTNMIKSTGINTNTASVIEYIGYVKDSCIMFSLDNFVSKFSDRESIKKHYFVDNGILNIFLNDGETSLLENICAIHLYRKHAGKLYYYNKNIEVDFYIPEENTGVQASFSMENADTFQREADALEKMDSVYPLEKMQIVTFNEESEIRLQNGKTIEIVPVWKWLLS